MTDEEMNPHSVLSFICAEALRLYEELIYPPRFLTQEDNVTSQATLTEEYLVALQDASKRSTSFVIVRAESYNHALTLPGVYLTNAKPVGVSSLAAIRFGGSSLLAVTEAVPQPQFSVNYGRNWPL